MKLLKEFKDMLTSDDSNKLSSKRVITFLAFILVSIAFIANLFWSLTIEPKIFDGFIQIVWAGLAVTVGEHLLKKKNTDPTPKPNEFIPPSPENSDESGGH